MKFNFACCTAPKHVQIWLNPSKAKKKKLLCCPHPTKIWKLGRSVDFFFFFFFLRTVRELSFPIFFFKFLDGENSGGMQSKRIYKCFFKPLNTNFCKFFAQIWHKKIFLKTRPCFFAFYGRSGEGNITIFLGGPKFMSILFSQFSLQVWGRQQCLTWCDACCSPRTSWCRRRWETGRATTATSPSSTSSRGRLIPHRSVFKGIV